MKIWQKGFQIAIKSYNLTKTFPNEEKFNLVSQINKCGVSIPSNIAEGSSRKSDKDYTRFLEISLGSTFEMETQLMIAEAIKMGNQALVHEIIRELDEEQKTLMAFMNKIKT